MLTESLKTTNTAAKWFLFMSCVLIAHINELSSQIMTFAIGDIRQDLSISLSNSQLLLTIGKLCFGSFLLAGGVLGDIYGHRRVLMTGVIGLIFASILAGTAQSSEILLAARAFDGLSSAAIAPLALALVVDTFAHEEQNKIIGYYIGFSALFNALGPLAVGEIIEIFGWRSGFLLSITLAAIGGLGVFIFGESIREPLKHLRFDFLGAFSCTVGLLGFVNGVIEGNNSGWLSLSVLLSLGVGIISLIFFVWWENKTVDPLVDLKFFQNRTFTVAVLTGLLVHFAMGGAILPLFYFLQTVKEVSAVGASLRILPMVIAAVITSFLMGILVKKFGKNRLILTGLVLLITGSIILSFLQPNTSYLQIFFALILIGAGNISVIVPVADTIISAVPSERTGGAVAINSAAGHIGGALGLAAIFSAFVAVRKKAYFLEMVPTGLSKEQIIDVTNVWREALRKSSAVNLPVIPDSLQIQIQDAYHQAFAKGIQFTFIITALSCILIGFIIWFGLREKKVIKI